jgi:hypothetical protein
VEILGMIGDRRKEPRNMAVEIHKELAIQLFAYAREAERSAAFSCLGPEQWVLLRDYYGPGKQAALREIANRLKPLIPPSSPLVDRSQFLRGTFTWLVRRPFIRLANRTKLKWRFSRHEITFIHQTLQCWIDILSLQPAPPPLVLFNMRGDLFTCEHMIKRHLDGIPEIEKASRMEHFCQSDYIEHVRIEDLLGYDKTGSDGVDGKAASANGRIVRRRPFGA